MYNNMNPNVVEAWQEAAPETAVRPWLASLLWQNGNRLWTRFVLFYRRLADMGRKNRRRLKIGLGTAALLLALSGAPTPAHAATITVGPGCTLVQAIQSANTDTSVGSCTAGSGADTIVLAGNTYSYDTAFGNDEAALPLIESEITIEANGATLQRTSGTMRILHINSGGDLTLNSATITGGNSDNRAGGILNVGTLSLNNSTIHGNTATEWGGGIYNLGGTVTINNSTISGNTGASGGIDTSGGTVTINNSTLTGNTATNVFGSGGVIVFNNGTINLNRTIISGNNGGEIRNDGGTINANNHNLFGDSGQNNTEAFVNFPPGASDRTATSNGTHPTALAGILDTTLDDNGGPTLTHALVSDSPAIEMVPTTDSGCDAGISTDQRGAVRADGPGRGGAACDAGAFEFGSNETPTAVSILQVNVMTQNEPGWLVGWLVGLLGATTALFLRLRHQS